MKVSEIVRYGIKVEVPKEFKLRWLKTFPRHTLHLQEIEIGNEKNMTLETLLPAYICAGEMCEVTIDALGVWRGMDNKEAVAFRVSVKVDETEIKGEGTLRFPAFSLGRIEGGEFKKIDKWTKIPEEKLTGKVKIWTVWESLKTL